MRILFSLTYSFPYISGLAVYAQRVAEGLDKRGFKVEILTSQYDKALEKEERVNSVLVSRVPYLLKFHKGLIMPTWISQGYKKVKRCDCLICHLPQVEGLWLLLLARIIKKKSIVVYHCDVNLPAGFLNGIIEKILTIINISSCFLADKIVSSSLDYSKHSPILSRFLNKVVEIFPPIKDFSWVRADGRSIEGQVKEFKYRIGFVGRLSADKGVEYLLEAISFLEGKVKNLGVFLVGPQDAVGEEEYVNKVYKLLDRHKDKVRMLGKLSEEDLAYFYRNIDVLVLPSINSTEAFGMVQVEAMLMGVPVIVSDLPGVRTAVKTTGMGEIIPPKSPEKIAEGITKVVKNKDKYQKPKEEIKKFFSLEKTIDDYEKILKI